MLLFLMQKVLPVSVLEQVPGDGKKKCMEKMPVLQLHGRIKIGVQVHDLCGKKY
jgi:hypothetical protein